MSTSRELPKLSFLNNKDGNNIDETILLNYIAHPDMKQKQRGRFLDRISNTPSGLDLLQKALAEVNRELKHFHSDGMYGHAYYVYGIRFDVFGGMNADRYVEGIGDRMVRDIEAAIGKKTLEMRLHIPEIEVYSPTQKR